MHAYPPVIRIVNGTFYRHHPGGASSPTHPNPAFFRNLNFELSSHSASPHRWCVVGPSLSGKTTFLQLLRGQHICVPPTARSYPYLATGAVRQQTQSANRAFQYVGFDAAGGASSLGPATSAYLSARYESRRAQTDFSLRDFLLGNTQLNPAEAALVDDSSVDAGLVARVVADLRLESLLELPVAFLSHGQGRRARIARALLTRPDVLLLDEPFMGLDPPTIAGLSPLLGSMAAQASPRLVLSARPQDPLPEWITHLAYLRADCQVGAMGEKDAVLGQLEGYARAVWQGHRAEDEALPVHALAEMGRTLTAEGIFGDGLADRAKCAAPESRSATSTSPPPAAMSRGEPIVEMNGCRVTYGDRVALGGWTEDVDGETRSGLHWTVRRGERWGIFGCNGSGKTTIVSLLCSDHPQTYSLPIKLFGRSRLPDAGSSQLPLTFWDIQSRVGHSSPEVHQHMPRNLSIRQVLASAWADTFRSRPKMGRREAEQIDAALRWFEHELNPVHSGRSSSCTQPSTDNNNKNSLGWADAYMLGELSFSAARVLLFLRAIIKHPDIVVLDEAFGGMDEAVRDKCMLFLARGEEKTLAPGGRSHQSVGAFAVESAVARSGQVKIAGLADHQALVCISHVKEEVPDCVREWLCLPEINSGEPARCGRLDGPLRRDGRRWAEIWGVGRGA